MQGLCINSKILKL